MGVFHIGSLSKTLDKYRIVRYLNLESLVASKTKNIFSHLNDTFDI